MPKSHSMHELAKALLDEAKKLEKGGYHELAAAATSAATDLEKGLAKQAKQEMEVLEEEATKNRLAGTRDRVRRLREREEEEPTL